MQRSRIHRLGWIAGTVGAPVAVAGYEVQDLPLDTLLGDTSGGYMAGSDVPVPRRNTGLHHEFPFSIDLAGVDGLSATVVPPWHRLLLAMGFSATNSGGGGGTWTYIMASTRLTTDLEAGSLLPIDFVHETDELQDTSIRNAVLNGVLNFVGPGDVKLNCAVLANHDGSIPGVPASAYLAAGAQATPVSLDNLSLSIAEAATGAGTVTTANAPGTRLIDSAAHFRRDGYKAGDTVANTTDGSTGTVLEVISETTLDLTAQLTGGIDNDFDSSDAYTITRAAMTGLRCTALRCDFGNQLRPRPGVTGTGTANGYHKPRIFARNPVLTFDFEEPYAAEANLQQMFRRGAILVPSFTHNASGAAGHRFAFSMTGKVGQHPGRSEGSDGENMISLVVEAIHTDPTKLFKIIHT